MGSTRVALCAGLLAAFALTPTAYAQDGGVSVSPSSPAPGSDVSLRVSDCTERSGTAVSGAFVADARLAGADGTLVGESRIRSTLTAGTYSVKISCGGSERTGRITVVGKAGTSQNAAPAGQPAHPSTTPASSTAPASPVAPVHAGGGGTARLSAVEPRPAGPGTAHAVTGLVLAGVAAAAVALRGVRRSRGAR